MNKTNNFSELKQLTNADARNRGIEATFVRFLKDPITRFSLALRLYEYPLNTAMFKPLRLLITIYFRSISLKLSFRGS